MHVGGVEAFGLLACDVVEHIGSFGIMVEAFCGRVAHRGEFGPAASSRADRTASLGLIYNYSFAGPGLRVDEIVKGGPFDKASSKMRAGCVINSINGKTLTHDTDYSELLADIAGRKTLVSFSTPDGTAMDEVVLPIGAVAFTDLLYERWVDSCVRYFSPLSNTSTSSCRRPPPFQRMSTTTPSRSL